MRGQGLIFCQLHSSRNNYHYGTDWLEYRINLVTRVTVGLQWKKISFNYWFDPQIVLMFSARTRYAKWCLFCVFYFFINYFIKFIIAFKVGFLMEGQV